MDHLLQPMNSLYMRTLLATIEIDSGEVVFFGGARG